MKKCIGVFLLILFAAAAVQAQDSLHLKKKITYKIKLQQLTGETVKGYLKQVTDSSVVYVVAKTYYGSQATASDRVMYYTTIKNIKLQRSGAGGRGAAIGAGVGLAAGLIVGSSMTNDDDGTNSGYGMSKDAGIALVAIMGTVAGTLFGSIIGSTAWRKYQIDGNTEKLAVLRLGVQKKVYDVSSSD